MPAVSYKLNSVKKEMKNFTEEATIPSGFLSPQGRGSEKETKA
jgi:hypothetical protein